jgi:hypothetical protein
MYLPILAAPGLVIKCKCIGVDRHNSRVLAGTNMMHKPVVIMFGCVWWEAVVDRDRGALLESLRVSLSLTAVFTIGSTIQVILSFIMAVMAGRAVCYGSSNVGIQIVNFIIFFNLHKEV